jgi:hypothetical protein
MPMATRMHTAKKKEELQKKESLTPPRQHEKFIFSKIDAFMKGIVHKRRCRPNHRSYDFTLEKVRSLKKQCLQQSHCQAQPTKARPED